MNLQASPFKLKIQMPLGIAVLCALLGCNQTVKRKNEITKIEFATSGMCKLPRRAMMLDSSLAFKFYVDSGYCNTEGPPIKLYTGSISRELWDTLNIKLERVNFKQIDSINKEEREINDAYGAEIIVHLNGKTRRISKLLSPYPRVPLDSLIDWLINTPSKIHLKPSKNTFQLTTTYQKQTFVD
jgi:hypothetical protein